MRFYGDRARSKREKGLGQSPNTWGHLDTRLRVYEWRAEKEHPVRKRSYGLEAKQRENLRKKGFIEDHR